ncbi:MAG: xylulokinase, partial [Synergistaceae bacterium]|nr:xylulokinase [Synergistaceae bacterium]
MFYIGIDLGTSAVKLLLADEKGNILNTVSEEYPISFPKPGWSEQNPEDWLKAVEKGMKTLTKDIDKSKVSGIGAGGQMHGLVILDENDKVLRPAILWNDGRTQEETEYLNNVIGTDKLTEYTGNIA